MNTEDHTTGCVCPVAGWCARHKMHKHPIWWRNCRTRPEWFALYEKGHRHEPDYQPGRAPPTLWRKALNLTRAILAAFMGKARGVPFLCPTKVAQARLEICQNCEFISEDKTTCTHQKCGCTVARKLVAGGMNPGKTQVSTQACPAGKWAPWTPPRRWWARRAPAIAEINYEIQNVK